MTSHCAGQRHDATGLPRAAPQNIDHRFFPRTKNESNLNEVAEREGGLNVSPAAVFVLERAVHEDSRLAFRFRLPRRRRLAAALATGVEGDQTFRRQLRDALREEPVDETARRPQRGHAPALAALASSGEFRAEFLRAVAVEDVRKLRLVTARGLVEIGGQFGGEFVFERPLFRREIGEARVGEAFHQLHHVAGGLFSEQA